MSFGGQVIWSKMTPSGGQANSSTMPPNQKSKQSRATGPISLQTLSITNIMLNRAATFDMTTRNRMTLLITTTKQFQILSAHLFNNFSANVFFHTSFVWLRNKSGNPYGPPVPYIDTIFDGSSLKKEMSIGSKYVQFKMKILNSFCIE